MIRKSGYYLLTGAFIASLLLMPLHSQDIMLRKQVIGTGGAVAIQNTEDMKLSGIGGQLAIGNASGQDALGKYINLYQGFWVPLPEEFLGVENPIIKNTFLENYPNPFNSTTTIKYTLPVSSFVTIQILDVTGKKIREFSIGYTSEGPHEIKWDAKDQIGVDAGSGSYIYELSVQPSSAFFGSSKSYTIRSVMVLVK